MQPTKYPSLPLDTDTSDQMLTPGRARFRLNSRVGGSKNGNVAAVENVPGTDLLVTSWTATKSFTVSCNEGEFGDPVTVNYTYTSFISQADADSVALAKAQALAEEELICSGTEPIWEFDETTIRCVQNAPRTSSARVARKIDIAPGSATHGQYQNDGEEFAYDSDAGACPITYYSAAISRPSVYTRSNCGSELVGTTWTINIAYGAYTSEVSQPAANALATAAANALDTQANANLHGTCITAPAYLQYSDFTFDDAGTTRRGFIILAYSDPAHTEDLIIDTPITIYYQKHGANCAGDTAELKSVVMQVGPDHVLAGNSFVGFNDEDSYNFPECLLTGQYVYTFLNGDGYYITP